MQYKKFRESEGLASLSRALRASHQVLPAFVIHSGWKSTLAVGPSTKVYRLLLQEVPQPNAVETTEDAQMDGAVFAPRKHATMSWLMNTIWHLYLHSSAGPSKPRKAKRHADMQTPGDAAGAKAKKKKKKVKQPQDDAVEDQHVKQAAHPHSEEREADGLPEPR